MNLHGFSWRRVCLYFMEVAVGSEMLLYFIFFPWCFFDVLVLGSASFYVVFRGQCS